MIDIHAHVLPTVDDGPADIKEAIEAIEQLAREGVTEIVATPHFNDRYPHVPASELLARVRALQRIAEHRNLPVRLFAGHEIRLARDTADMLASGTAATINDGPYVLIELPSGDFPADLAATITSLRTSGFIPVLSHVERYRPTIANPDVLVPLVEAGAIMQVTASSIVGSFGEQVRETTEILLRRNLAHVFGSDVHALPIRQPYFSVGIKRAAAIVGSQRIREMTTVMPSAILYGDPVELPPVLAPAEVRHYGFRIRRQSTDG